MHIYIYHIQPLIALVTLHIYIHIIALVTLNIYSHIIALVTLHIYSHINALDTNIYIYTSI